MNLFGHSRFGAAVVLTSLALSLSGAPVSVAQIGNADERAEIVRGRAALSDGLFGVAEDQFRSLLAAGTGDGAGDEEVTILLIRALHAQKKHEEILKLLGSRKTVSSSGGFSFWRAMSEYNLGQNEKALTLLTDFETSFKNDEYASRVERLRSACYLALDRVEDAIASFERFDRQFAKSQESSANLLSWGRTLVLQGQSAEAESVLKRLAAFPVNGNDTVLQGYLWLGRARINVGKLAEAGKTLDALCGSATVTGDLKAEAWLDRAEVYVAMTNTQQAVTAITSAVAAAVSPVLKGRGSTSLGWLYLDSGNLDAGVPILKEFISAFPDDPLSAESQLKLSASFLQTNRYEDAVNEFQHYLETFTDEQGQAQAYEGKGWGLMGLGRHAEAATAFIKGYGLHNDAVKKGQCLLKAGDAYFSNAQYRLSRETYRRVLDEFPSGKLTANALLQLGASMVRSGDHEEAEKVFRQAVKDYPGGALAEEALYKVALLKESLKDWREAVETYSELIGTHTNGVFVAKAIHGRGLVRYRLFRFKEAAEDFERVVKLYSGTKSAEQAFYMRGLCYYGLMRDEEAVGICREFIVKYPESPWIAEVLFWMAKYSYNRGDYERSEKEFLLAVEKKPEGALGDDGLLWAGISAAKRKEYLRANEHFNRLVKEYEKSDKIAEARFSQADALCELAHFSAAILIFDEIITKYPESDFVAAAWGRKGDCQFTLGADDAKRYEESIASFRVVANSSGTRLDLVMQAEYKIGRCLEKQGQAKGALDQYYLKVIIRYFEDREKGIWHNENSKVWFTRAAFNAADIMEERKDWRGVVSILERVVKSGVPSADEARERIEKIKSEQWWLF
ncbi:MAG: tetratricopeptide repeat protein [Kiritimatiellia bacterium]|jgi:TolA-binding protein|nr:tetratricopeptide repeat protein [Kiritimatiellia bacterium]